MIEKKSIFMFSEEDEKLLIQSVQPLSNTVERSALRKSAFDPDAFLSSKRHLGLERIKAELNSHLKALKTELVELINKDYQDFINLSTNLKGVDREMESLRIPLVKMEKQVKDLSEYFQSMIDTLESQLQSRGQVRDKKSTLKLLLNIHDSMTKVENLLGINSDSLQETSGKEIERVAIEYNQMRHLVRRGQDLSFVIENGWRLNRIKEMIEERLGTTLRHALRDGQGLDRCLRTYALMDQTSIAEGIIREDWIRPALKGWIQAGKQPRYDLILQFATQTLSRWVEMAGYEILVNTLWVEVVERMNEDCRFVFAAGQTDIFHKNYTAAMTFVAGLEGLCSKKSILYLRQHPTYIEFMKKWQLLVYFQLRFREIVKEVEDTLGHSRENSPLSVQDVSVLGKNVVLTAIEQCWSDSVYIYGLSHRFWKLSLQLIKRYHDWVIQLVKSENIKENEKKGIYKDVDDFIKKMNLNLNEIILPKLPSHLQDLPSFKECMQDRLLDLKKVQNIQV